jgi:hypothetical protein
MSLSYIIEQVCVECGYDVVNDRALLLRQINKAWKEIYESTDLPGSLREVTVLVSADSIVALPYYVGELRNIRAHYSMERLTLQELQSKYSFQPWSQIWNNWRVMKKSPVKTCILSGVLPLFLTMEDSDSVDVNITVTGRTAKSARVSETVTLSAGDTETQLENNFIEIFSITKDVINTNDITLTGADTDGNETELSVIPNNKLSSIYTIINVSQLPSGGEQGTTYRYVDVLYKEPLSQLSDDGDELSCQGFDDAVVMKCAEYFYTSKDDGETKAIAYHAKCDELVGNATHDRNMETEKTITFAPQGYFGLYQPSWSYQRVPWRQI